MNNAIYIRRRGKMVLPDARVAEMLPLNTVLTLVKNLETLGFTYSEPLFNACRTLPLDVLALVYIQLVQDLKQLVGANHKFEPMYPGFPKQVMEMSESRLYFNAIVHYWSGGKLFPLTKLSLRRPLKKIPEPRVITLGELSDFETLFGQIVGANASLSEQDRADVTWFVEAYRDDIWRLMPEKITQKETIAFLASLLARHTTNPVEFVSKYCRTATDVLRMAAAMSDGDVSLAKSTKFRSFTRPERRLMLELLERMANPTEDMLRWKDRWIRLGERVHPGERKAKFPKAAEAFDVLRKDLPFATFNSGVESALAQRNVAKAVSALSKRPGDLARRLDHLLRVDAGEQEAVVAAFMEAARKVSTPVLLQVRQHFKQRSRPPKLRVFFPKGNLARAQAVENNLPALPEAVSALVVASCDVALVERFRELPSLGRVYIDEKLSDYMVPFSQRSASRSFRTLVRGSRLPLPVDAKVLRFFVWWKNGKDRTDIDLSAAMFGDNFEYRDIVSYYNLKGYGGCHSGDIVDAPKGASEFIDISLDKTRRQGIRYVVMTLTSYTRQPYCDLPECFAGWMARSKPNSGEIYDPRTVVDKLDVTADTRIAIPLIIDLFKETVIWCDLALKRHPGYQNNVHGNLKGIQLTLQSLVKMRKPNLFDLFSLHAEARGEHIGSPDGADTVFSVESGTPFRLEEIASDYMR